MNKSALPFRLPVPLAHRRRETLRMLLSRLAHDRNYDCFIDDDDDITVTHRLSPRRFTGSPAEAEHYLHGLSSW